MRFKKGSKVEVMNKMEVPTSWCVAEIISGNGHTYNLKYDCCPDVENVSRKFIRPCPPPAKDLQSCVSGDIVEVFDDNSWKAATISKVLGGGYFSVRPHGLTQEMNAHKSNIRARQSWRDGQWFSIGKISGSYGNVKVSRMVEPNSHAKLGLQIPLADAKICDEKDNCLVFYNDAGLPESRVVSSKTLKRASPFCSSRLEASLVNAKKFKAADQSLEKGRNWRHASLASKGPNKIDLGSVAFLLEKKQCDILSIHFATDKTVCCHWHLSEEYKHLWLINEPQISSLMLLVNFFVISG